MSEYYRKILKQFSVSYFFVLLSFVSSPILIFLLTRTLSVEEYGIYAILAASISFLHSFFLLGFPYYIRTKIPGLPEKKKLQSIFSIFIFEAVFLTIVLAVVALTPLKDIFLNLLKIPVYGTEFIISLFIIGISILFTINEYFMRAERRIESASLINYTNTSIWVFLLLIFFFFTGTFNLLTVLSIWAIGVSLSFILSFFYLRKEITAFIKRSFSISKLLLKQAIFFSLPLIPFTISSWIITVSDRYMINYYMDASNTGIYSLAYSLTTILLTFSGVISNVLYPYISKSWNEKKNHHILFNAMLKYNLIILFPGMVGLFILRSQIISLVSGTRYLIGAPSIAILIPYPLFAAISMIYTNQLLLRNRTKLIATINIIAAGLNIILNMVLIPSHGIAGAAMATVISYLFLFIILFILTRKQFIWKMPFLRIGRIMMASLIMGVIVYMVNPQIYLTKIIAIAIGVITYGTLIILFRVITKQEYKIIFSFIPKCFLGIFKKS